MNLSNKLIPKWFLLGITIVALAFAGLLAFQRSPIQIEGYLDEEETIRYSAGQDHEDPDNVGVAVNWTRGETDPTKLQERMDHYVRVSRRFGMCQ